MQRIGFDPGLTYILYRCMKAAMAKVVPKEIFMATLSWTAERRSTLVTYFCSLLYGRTLMP